LTTSDFHFGARPWEMNSSASICALCPVGCNITFNTRREARTNGQVVIKRAMPRQNEQVNEIWMCDKGRFGWHYTENEERLTEPLIKQNGSLIPVDWDMAVAAAAEKLKAGRNIIVLASGRLANEDLLNLKQLANCLHGDALLYDSLPGGEMTTTHGVDTGTNIGDMGAGTTILVASTDLYHEAPLWFLRVKQAADRGANLLVVHTEDTRLDKHARQVVRCGKGEVADTIVGLSPDLKKSLSADDNLVIFFSSDGNTSTLAEVCAQLVEDRRGKPNNGLIGVWPRANDQAAWEMGYKQVPDLAGALEGKTVFIAAADPAGDDSRLASALGAAKAVVVQELFLTATARLADVVLPALAFTEREGSYTSGERRVQRFSPALTVEGKGKPDFSITALVAHGLGIDLEGGSPRKVMDRMAVIVPSFKGISYEKLAEVQEQWPIIGRADLYYGGTSYQNTQGLGVHLGQPVGKA